MSKKSPKTLEVVVRVRSVRNPTSDHSITPGYITANLVIALRTHLAKLLAQHDVREVLLDLR